MPYTHMCAVLRFAARRQAVKHAQRVAELTWGRVVFRAWRHEVDLHKRDPTVIASHILARHAQQRRQRELLQRWASGARDLRTAAATRLIAERCHAALASAILERRSSFGGGALGGSSGPSADDPAEYEPLQIERRASAAPIPAVSFAPTSCADATEEHAEAHAEEAEEYTPFEPTSSCCAGSSPTTAKAQAAAAAAHAQAQAAARRRARRRLAPLDVESVAVSTANLIHRLVSRLHGATEWLSRAAAAAAEAELMDEEVIANARDIANALRGGSAARSAPATPPSGWRHAAAAAPLALASAAPRALDSGAGKASSGAASSIGQKHASRCLLDATLDDSYTDASSDEDATMDTSVTEHEHEHEHTHKIANGTNGEKRMGPPPSPLAPRALSVGAPAQGKHEGKHD